MKTLAHCRELPGLPGEGERPRQYSATGQGMHREGYVVEFTPNQGQPWVGNFQPGVTSFTDLAEFPHSDSVLVVANGQGYLVDIQSGILLTQYESDIDFLFSSPAADLVIAGTVTDFSAFRGAAKVWCTRRISWDGFRNLAVLGNQLTGEAWCFDNSWHSFSVDLADGKVTGGSYYE
ncbi:MAG: hypothetical protein ACKVOT_00360 [Polaromonas sp.]